MIKMSDLASELNLGDSELRAVCKMAGVAVSPATTHLGEEDAQHVRDILAGRVAVKPPRKRVSVPPGKLAVATVVALLLVGAIVAIGAWSSQPASVTVRPGDCFNEPDVFAFSLTPVSCAGSHKYRAYAKMDLTAKWDVYPGRDIVEQHVRSRCEALRGSRGESSFGGFAVYYFYPQEGAWSRGARSAICAERDR